MSIARVRVVLPFLAVFSLACGASKEVGTDEFIEDKDGGTTTEGGIDFEVGGDGGVLEGGPTLAGLELTPTNAVVTIDTTTTPPTKATITYKAVLNKDDGSSSDVSSITRTTRCARTAARPTSRCACTRS